MGLQLVTSGGDTNTDLLILGEETDYPSAADYFSISTADNGATTITTNDNTSNVAHLTLI